MIRWIMYQIEKLFRIVRRRRRRQTHTIQLSPERHVKDSPEIDLEALPHAELTAWLHTMICDILNTVLGGEPQRMNRYFEGKQYETIASNNGSATKSLDNLVSNAVKEKLSLTQWREFTVLEIERRLGIRVHQFKMPDDMWDMIAIAAWETPAFRLWMVERIHKALYQTLWYHTGVIPLVEIHKNTLWILLAGFPFQGFSHQKQDALKHLQSTAIQIAWRTRHWAGHWDQWLLWQAYKAWHPKSNWDAEMAQSLSKLPIKDYKVGHQAPSHELVNPLWIRATPDWFFDWLSNESVQFL